MAERKAVAPPVLVDYTVGLVAAPCLWGLCSAGQCRHIPETYRWKHCKTGICACNNQHEDYVPVEGRLVVEGCATAAGYKVAADTLAELEVVDTLAEPGAAAADKLAEPGAAAADKLAAQ